MLVEQMPAMIYTERIEPGHDAGRSAIDYVSPHVDAMLGLLRERLARRRRTAGAR